MRRRHAATTVLFLGVLLAPLRAATARVLTMEDRVKAQEAIDRVYYSHQVGATRPFEEAERHDLPERKVRAYLKQSAALETIWRTTLTPETLQHELQRITRSTRAPARLEEVFQALGHDSFLIQECFVRPILVNRLARNFFSTDAKFHGDAKRRAEDLRGRLLRNPRLPPGAGIELRIVEVIRGEERASRSDLENGVLRLHVGRSEFEHVRSTSPKTAREVGPLVESPESYDIQILLDASEDSLRLATYTIEKVRWDDWWNAASRSFDETAVESVAEMAETPAIRALVAGGPSGGACVEDDTWMNVGLDDPPVQNYGHVAVWTGNEMLTWGGVANVPARYDPLTDTWGRLSTKNAPPAGFLAPAVWTGTEMIVWGGSGSSEGGRYDPLSDTWKPISTAGAPTSSGGHTLIWTGTTMIVWGTQPTMAGGRYDPATDTWSPVSTLGAPDPRTDFTAVWSGTEMIVWGGYDGATYLSTGARYDPITDTWRSVSGNGAPSPRAFHTAVRADSLMLVWGGYDGNSAAPLATGARYDPQTDTWTPISSFNGPSGRYLHTATWTGSEMLIWGGLGIGSQDSGARYDPGSDVWTSMTVTNAPAARFEHTAVWTGRLLIVWGGLGDGAISASGGRYDPVSDSWTPTAASNRPTPRNGHSAIWTGTRMIVWGGVGPTNTLLKSGASYDPLAATWTAISTLDAPSPRSEHVAVWSGSVMIAWGGLAGDDHRGTGGRYDPVEDSWSPTNIAGAPTWNVFRTGASAVWTGTTMIVWGGVDTGERYFGDGARYDPATDTWDPISLTGAPAARAWHAAVWTGSTMLLWGGFRRPIGGPDTYLDDGFAYLPATDTWGALSHSGAPSPREHHTAIWTGQNMLIWGGDGPSGGLGDGAAYDPQADAWETASTAGAPPPFSFPHTAVWADPFMIVWGVGQPGSDSGGRYNSITKTWKTLSDKGSPSWRAHQSAVWTGAEMIIWGGDENGSLLDTGGAYQVDLSPDADHDGSTVCAGDCDDANPAVHPGAVEWCNGRDDDCDGEVDDGFAVGTACVGDVDSCHRIVGALSCNADGTGTECTGAVVLHDTTPPEIAVSALPSLLWPPNHRLVDVAASVTASDACGAVAVSLVSITSTEADDVPGDGDGETVNDILGAADFNFSLRAERDGGEGGRTYQVTYSAVDGSGNSSSATSLVFVPHDEGGVTEPMMLSVEDDAAGTIVQWDAVTGAVSYRVVRGNVGNLKVAADFIDLGTVSCIQPATAATSTQGHEDAAIPSAGEAFFYLAAYNDGGDSGYGTVSAAKPRIVTGGGCE